jgi:hypothetical protein
MASPTIIRHGNNLITPIAQPGWQVESDGFGLLQSQVKFKWTNSQMNGFTTTFAKGATFQSLVGVIGPSNLAQLKVWKANYVYEKADLLTVTADFCGIDPNVNGGQFTNMQMVMTGATASEPIEHHPNFLVRNCISISPGNVLAGWPPASGWDESITTNPNRALWTPKVASGGATQGQQFVGFLPNQKVEEYNAGNINIKAGIKNYYKPSLTLRGLWYMASETAALDIASYVGYCTDGTNMGMPEAYRKLAKDNGYSGNFQYTALYDSKINRTFLITSCSVEQFGGIYKVTMDFTMSGISGWDPDVYPTMVA